MIHYTLAEEPVTDADYEVVSKRLQPSLFLGCRIQHKYDEERISVNKQLKIKNLRLGDTFLKALSAPVDKQGIFNLLYRQLNIVDDNKLTDTIYEKLLNSFGLSSSECFSYRRAGVYPINSTHYGKFTPSSNSDLLNYYYENFFDNTNVECKWQNFSYLSLFILINKC